jgi:site-specific recombinase XerD
MPIRSAEAYLGTVDYFITESRLDQKLGNSNSLMLRYAFTNNREASEAFNSGDLINVNRYLLDCPRFIIARTLRRPEFRVFLPYPRDRRSLPVILSRDEVAELINAASDLFRRALLMALYGTGMPAVRSTQRGKRGAVCTRRAKIQLICW